MEYVWITLACLLCAAIAFVLAWLLAERRSRSVSTEIQTRLALAESQSKQLSDEASQTGKLCEQLRVEVSRLQQDRASLSARLQAEKDNVTDQRGLLAQSVADLEERLAIAQQSFDQARNHLGSIQQERATLAAQLEAEKQNVIDQRQLLTDASTRFREVFAELSVASLSKNTEQFMSLAEQTFKSLSTEATGSLEQRKLEIAALVDPMKQTLEQYHVHLKQLELTRQDAYLSLSQQLSSVATTQQNLSVETKQLVTALRKPSGRGRWGEITLQRLFELAGMAQHVMFRDQVSVDTEDGRHRPDCIVDLPNNRRVIIDAKCVLEAFLDASECQDDALRAQHLLRHARQVRSRVTELSSKAYQNQFDDVPEYVVLFLPGEAFLYAAVEQDPLIIEDAMKDKVIIASPTSLLGMLRVVEHAWRQKEVEQNAEAIRQLGEELYDRVAILAEHFQDLGGALEKSVKSYNKTLKSLETRVITTAKKMSEMGVAGTKELKEPVVVEETIHDLGDKWRALPKPADEVPQP